jgi:predicted RecA/RadA family phage recombinase
MAHRIKSGATIDYAPGSAVEGGTLAFVGPIAGITPGPIGAGQTGTLEIEGVFALDKATGSSTAIAAGAPLFWDAANTVATTDDDSGANKRVGVAVAAATDDDSAVRAILNR